MYTSPGSVWGTASEPKPMHSHLSPDAGGELGPLLHRDKLRSIWSMARYSIQHSIQYIYIYIIEIRNILIEPYTVYELIYSFIYIYIYILMLS